MTGGSFYPGGHSTLRHRIKLITCLSSEKFEKIGEGGEAFFFFFFFLQVQPYNRKYRSIGHRVWSMSLNILTELSVNSKSTIALNPWHTHSDAVLGAS